LPTYRTYVQGRRKHFDIGDIVFGYVSENKQPFCLFTPWLCYIQNSIDIQYSIGIVVANEKTVLDKSAFGFVILVY